MPRRLSFFAIVWAYTWLVALYAVNTPAWQVPDEPAHFNYIRVIAEQASLPVLQAGDYDQAYLDDIKARHFPASMSIDSLRYEYHQPPLYYLVVTPFYKVGEVTPRYIRLLGLRLGSALWGAVLLALVYRIAAEILPVERLLPLFATALVGFVPQHLAMLAGVENDTLADVLLAAVVLGLIRIHRLSARGTASEQKTWWAVGLLTGLGLLTKTTTYVSAGLIAVTFLLMWPDRTRLRRSLTLAAPALMFALFLGGLWFGRDALTYGPTDWLGLERHNAVVVGQPRTLQLYPTYLAAAGDFFPTLFRSFWGQFGWMGVPLDARLYLLLFAFVVFALVGLAWYLVDFHRGTDPEVHNERVGPNLTLLAAWFALTLLATVAYSLEFYQAQGRYLFPAIGSIGIFLALGILGWVHGAANAFRHLPEGRSAGEWIVLIALAVGMIVMDWIGLYRYLIPALR
jgi:hypothetical protein